MGRVCEHGGDEFRAVKLAASVLDASGRLVRRGATQMEFVPGE